MRIDLWPIPVLGAFAEGMVWGWLLLLMAAPVGPRSRILIVAAVLVAGAVVSMAAHSLPPLALGIAAGVALHLLFRYLLHSRRTGSSAFGGQIS